MPPRTNGRRSRVRELLFGDLTPCTGMTTVFVHEVPSVVRPSVTATAPSPEVTPTALVVAAGAAAPRPAPAATAPWVRRPPATVVGPERELAGVGADPTRCMVAESIRLRRLNDLSEDVVLSALRLAGSIDQRWPSLVALLAYTPAFDDVTVRLNSRSANVVRCKEAAEENPQA